MAESADLQEGLQPSSAVVCGADLSSLPQEPVSAAVGSAGRRHVVSPASSPVLLTPLLGVVQRPPPGESVPLPAAGESLEALRMIHILYVFCVVVVCVR